MERVYALYLALDAVELRLHDFLFALRAAQVRFLRYRGEYSQLCASITVQNFMDLSVVELGVQRIQSARLDL